MRITPVLASRPRLLSLSSVSTLQLSAGGSLGCASTGTECRGVVLATDQSAATGSHSRLGRSNNVAQNDGTSLYYPSYFCGASSGPKYFYAYKSCGWFFQPDGYWAQGSWNGDSFSPKCAPALQGAQRLHMSLTYLGYPLHVDRRRLALLSIDDVMRLHTAREQHCWQRAPPSANACGGSACPMLLGAAHFSAFA